ncbi:hypothetical protein Tco_0945178 [Tanacetum coccineum]
MLTKPHVFYDDAHKQALGYQNSFYLKEAQQIRPTLYDGTVISKNHDNKLSNAKSEQLDIIQTPVEIEVPKELPKISLVKISFQKLKNHLASFDKVVKVRTTPDAITEGSWGFEHTKKLLADSKCLDIVHICVNSLASCNDCREMQHGFIDKYNENLMLKAELAKKGQMVEKTTFDEVVLRCSRLENRNVNLELKLQHQKESFLLNKSLNNQNAPEIMKFFKINKWQARLDAKDISITNLRKHVESLKGNNMVEKDVRLNNPNVIAPRMFKLDLAPLAPKLLNNKDAHIDYIKHSREHADTLWEIVEH